MVTILEANQENIEKAAEIIQNGGIVGFPSETVYGIGADCQNDLAVAKIYSIKKRPHFNPLIIHVADIDMAMQYAIFSDNEKKIINAFWPAPITIVTQLKQPTKISKLALAGLNSVAIRIPDNYTTRKLIEIIQKPLAAPSANISGRPSPTKAQHVEQQFQNHEFIVLDDGKCQNGIESTIVAVRADKFAILRQGAISQELIIKKTNLQPRKKNQAEKRGSVNAPGQTDKHYAPQANIRINATKYLNNEIWFGFGKPVNGVPEKNILWLSKNSDLQEAAANLFDCMHKCDINNVKNIAVPSIPKTGIGVAINDRLEKAAQKKETKKIE